MAKMYPGDIEGYERATEGEKRVFRFIKEAARPHKDFICWYEPSIGRSDKEPDFLLFGKKLGLLILEVKDWTSRQIISYTPHQFTIRVSGKTEKKTNPFKQAKGYVHALMDQLKEFPDFLTDLPDHVGQLKIPVGRIVVFPNIQRHDYLDRGLKWLIPLENVMLQEDLDVAGEIFCDTSGGKFHDRISASFPFPFKGLTQKEIDKLSFVIWPVSQIGLPLRQGTGKTRFQAEVRALDEGQARLAKRLKSGHLIIKGPPGSGKTLVLVHRCCQLHKYGSQAKKILLVCYNIALVSYLKRLIHEKGLGVGDGGIHVCHFYELCSRILEETIHYENEENEYYDLVVRETFAKVANGESLVGTFDAIFVDEGQDFGDEMLKTVLSLLKPGGDLVINLDSYQDLYSRRASWKSLGVKAAGRTKYLNNVYRNTVEIFQFTQRFIGQTPSDSQQLSLLPSDFAFHGDLPELRQFPNYDETGEFLVNDIRESVGQGEFKRSEIAVIYDDKVYGPEGFAYDNRSLPMRIHKKLEVSGIPTYWVSQDVRAKEMFDITTDRISLVSIHSAKGLDFDLVYLAGIDHIRPTDQTRNSLINLIYVAMTRAKYRLVIPYVEETEFIERIKGCLPT
jgi:hypothetical protein